MSSQIVPRRMTPEDHWSLHRVGDPVVSPDGRRAAYAVATPVKAENRSLSCIQLVDLQTAAVTRLTAGTHCDHSPAWSPDGQQLAFVSNRAGEAHQLLVIPVDGGEARILTQLPVSVRNPVWFPDGQRIAFLAAVPPDEQDWTEIAGRIKARAEAKSRPRVTEDRLYRYWDHWLTDGDYFHIFMLHVGTGVITDLTPGLARHIDLMDPNGAFDIAPDGQEVAYCSNTIGAPHATLSWGIYIQPVSGGNPRLISPAGGHHWRPRYSPEGRYLVWGKQQASDFYADTIRLERYDRNTGGVLPLTDGFDRSCCSWIFSRDGSTLYFVAEDNQRQPAFAVSINGGLPRTVVPGGTVSGLECTPDSMLVFNYSTVSAPPEIATAPATGGLPVVLTRTNASMLEEFQLGEVVERRCAGADGATISMFVVLPPGHDARRPYPLLQQIHGGPHGAYVDGWHWRWNPHLFAAQGLCVALVNFHGSTSFGDAFTRSICGQHPFKPFDDIMASTQFLIDEGLADAERLAAAGASYGGYLISWIAGHTDRFKALVNHAGVYNLPAQFSSDATYERRYAYGGAPWDGLERIEAQSPHRFAREFVTPILITHGDQDFRVPMTHGLELFNILKARGIPARLVSYPDENHWILKPQNSLHWYGEVLSWLERWGIAG